MQELCSSVSNKAFRHVETLLVQGNQVRTDQNKYPFLLIKKVCFDQYELDYLGRIKFLHVEMPYMLKRSPPAIDLVYKPLSLKTYI